MSKTATVAAPCALVQVIHVQWDKSARGGQGARNRNSVPLSLPVSAERLAGAAGQFHIEESYWGGRNAFAEPVRFLQNRVALRKDFRFGCVAVEWSAEALVIRYQYDGSRGGAPERMFDAHTSVRVPAVRALPAGLMEWVRVRYNGRFSGVEGYWWYEQVTVNVAWLLEVTESRVFVDSVPARELNLLADLW
jgi:hypothetical protein